VKNLLALFLFLTAAANATVIYSADGTLDPGDPTQVGRLFRDSTTSEWGSNKANPGLSLDVGTHEYDAYLLSVPSFLFPVFYEVELTSADGANLFVATYNSAGFDASDPSTNYLADAGFSGLDAIYRFSLADGTVPFTTVVSATPGGSYTGSYHLTISAFSDTNRTNLDGSSPVPEPSTGLLAVSALGVLGLVRRLQTRPQQSR
jgi:PEP-CTERM motif